MFPLIAHGPLGPFDELFAILAVGIFLVMFFAPLVKTWLARETPADDSAAAPEAGIPEIQAEGVDRFKLE